MKQCTINSCNRKHYGHGYCSKHYLRWYAHGDPLIVKYEYHGASKTPEYGIWLGIKKRCYNKSSVAYSSYGGRGIVMCDEWRTSFQVFLNDMGNRPSDRHSIDRIDVDGNYEPANCRWATDSVQNVNKRKVSPHPRIYKVHNKTGPTWLVLIILSRKTLINHRFKTLHDAVQARDRVMLEHGIE